MATENANIRIAEVNSPKVVCDELILSGTSIKHIAKDYENADDAALINKGMLDSALLDIRTALKSIDPEGDLFQDLAVISLSQIDSYFNNDYEFVWNNWILAENSAKCPGDIYDNSLTINNAAFHQPGTYMITIEFSDIPSGYVELRKNDSWIATFREVGESAVSFTIDDINTDVIRLVGVGINRNETVICSRLSLYYVTNRLQEFIREKIRTQINIDASNFVSTEMYQHAQDEFRNRFEAMTTRYLAELSAHEADPNAHNVSAESIGAARADHTHSQYATTAAMNSIITDRLRDYALVDHTHDEYLTVDRTTEVINEAMRTQLANMVTIPPSIITDAPLGLLPSRFSHLDITPATALILPTLINHVNDASYDPACGLVTTNKEIFINEAPKLFSIDDQYASLLKEEIQSIATFRLQLHVPRKISSYTIRCRNGKLTDWKVFSGNTTFIHRVTNPTNYQLINSSYVCSISFPEPIVFDSIAFMMLDATADIDVKIEFVLSDITQSNIQLTNEKFGVCVPTAGANRIVEFPEVAEFRRLGSSVLAPDLPYYIFAKAEINQDPVLVGSYYLPEYGTVRKGINIFAGKFQANVSSVVGSETYVSQVYGTLSLSEGVSNPSTNLLNIYKGEESWYTQPDTTRATIVQTINSDRVLLMGYMLTWRKDDADFVPSTWTLTAIGKDRSGNDVTVVLDSVDQYYPFYSVEDDDIVYHARFTPEIYVKRIELTFETNRQDGVVSLNTLALYLSERFYSIPQNKMYLGFEPVSETCIGSAVYTNNGWVPNNSYLGKFCVVPINNLQRAEPGTTYTVVNPFHTTNIQATVQPYGLMDIDEIEAPDAYVLSITEEEIQVTCNTSCIYALAVNRTW